MTPTILERIYNLASGESCPHYPVAASILRKLASADNAVSKAAFATAVLADVHEPGDQARILDAIEALTK